MEIKIKLNDYCDINARYQWDNRGAIFGEMIANTKDRKVLSAIKKHINYLEKKLRHQKKIRSKEDKMLSYILSQGYPVEYV